MLEQTWAYALDHRTDVLLALRQHLLLCVVALVIALAISVPLGIWTSRSRFGQGIVAAVTAVRVVPSLAVLAFVLPIFGVGYKAAVIALIVLACPPILINTDIAFRGIQPAVREAAIGMGMRDAQLLRRIEYPLAFPVMMAGVRTSTIEVIASATLAAFIGGGGFGDFILDGLANNDMRQLLVGAIMVSLLALFAEFLLSTLARTSAARHGVSAHV